jgi:hypothetical protein
MENFQDNFYEKIWRKLKFVEVTSMKKFILFTLILAFYNVNSLEAKSGQKVFKGRVISVSSESVEIKRGKYEKILFFDESTKVLKNNAEASKSDIEVCQLVKAYFSVEGKKYTLTKIEIMKESDCVKD